MCGLFRRERQMASGAALFAIEVNVHNLLSDGRYKLPKLIEGSMEYCMASIKSYFAACLVDNIHQTSGIRGYTPRKVLKCHGEIPLRAIIDEKAQFVRGVPGVEIAIEVQYGDGTTKVSN